MHDTGQSDCLRGQFDPLQAGARGGRIALGEYQVQHVQHRGEPNIAVRFGWRREGDATVFDGLLGAGDASGHGRLGDEETAGYLGGGQAADRPQCERDLRGGAQGWVAAQEQQNQGVVGVGRPPIGGRAQPVLGQRPAGDRFLASPTGLLALMLLTDARREARTGPGGELVPMQVQNRAHWNAAAITEGIALVTEALPRGVPGPYQLQAAIAALHDEAPGYHDTDWPQIMLLYERLLALVDNPMIALNHAVAVAMALGPQRGLKLVAALEAEGRLGDDHRLHAVRAHLLELTGDTGAARVAYLLAAQRTTSIPQQRYLNTRAARLVVDALDPR